MKGSRVHRAECIGLYINIVATKSEQCKALEKFSCSEVLLFIPIHPQGLEREVGIYAVVAG